MHQNTFKKNTGNKLISALVVLSVVFSPLSLHARNITIQEQDFFATLSAEANAVLSNQNASSAARAEANLTLDLVDKRIREIQLEPQINDSAEVQNLISSANQTLSKQNPTEEELKDAREDLERTKSRSESLEPRAQQELKVQLNDALQQSKVLLNKTGTSQQEKQQAQQILQQVSRELSNAGLNPQQMANQLVQAGGQAIQNALPQGLTNGPLGQILGGNGDVLSMAAQIANGGGGQLLKNIGGNFVNGVLNKTVSNAAVRSIGGELLGQAINGNLNKETLIGIGTKVLGGFLSKALSGNDVGGIFKNGAGGVAEQVLGGGLEGIIGENNVIGGAASGAIGGAIGGVIGEGSAQSQVEVFEGGGQGSGATGGQVVEISTDAATACTSGGVENKLLQDFQRNLVAGFNGSNGGSSNFNSGGFGGNGSNGGGSNFNSGGFGGNGSNGGGASSINQNPTIGDGINQIGSAIVNGVRDTINSIPGTANGIATNIAGQQINSALGSAGPAGQIIGQVVNTNQIASGVGNIAEGAVRATGRGLQNVGRSIFGANESSSALTQAGSSAGSALSTGGSQLSSGGFFSGGANGASGAIGGVAGAGTGAISGIAGQAFGEIGNAAGELVGGGAVGDIVGGVAGDAVAAAAGEVLGPIAGVAGGAIGGLAVPVNTVSINENIYQIEKDIIKIEEYMRFLTQKEAGLTEAEEGGDAFKYDSLDAIAYCIAAKTAAYQAKAAANWIQKAYGGNPAFVEDYPRFFQDTGDIATERFVEDVQENSACKSIDTEIAKRIAENAVQKPYHESKCSVEQSEEDDGSIEAFMNKNANLDNDPAWRYFRIRAEQDFNKATELQDTQFELEQEYLISKKEEESGQIQIPARFLLHDALRRTEVPYDMLANFDENSEGALFEFLGDVFEGGPGAVYREPAGVETGEGVDAGFIFDGLDTPGFDTTNPGGIDGGFNFPGLDS